MLEGNWRSIESCPKDGSSFLIYSDVTDDHQVVHYNGEGPHGNDYWCLCTGDGPIYNIASYSHWQPLTRPGEGI